MRSNRLNAGKRQISVPLEFIFNRLLPLEKINLCRDDLVQVLVAAFVDVSITFHTVWRDDKPQGTVVVANQVSADTTDRAFKRVLNAVPVGLAFHNQVGVAVRAKAHVRISQPCPLLIWRIDGFDDVFTEMFGALQLLRS